MDVGRIVMVAGSLAAGMLAAGVAFANGCPHPPQLALSLVAADGNGSDAAAAIAAAPCGDPGAPRTWQSQPAGGARLCVAPDGPYGSYRTWTVAFGLADPGRPVPVSPTCIETTTVGWRTLREYRAGALPWIGDRDGDGSAELILWDSFPLQDEATLAEYGLVAWVYRLTTPSQLALDWDLTRALAREIAAEYRAPSARLAAKLMPGALAQREQAARLLDELADGSCQAGTHSAQP